MNTFTDKTPLAPQEASSPAEANGDRRTVRTKKALRAAFAELALDCGLGNFSVSELCDKADLNRGTFYAHYSDMDDLLACYEDEIVASLLQYEEKLQKIKLSELLAARLSGKPPAVAIELFELLQSHGTMLSVLLGERGDAGFQARMRDGVCANLVRGVLHKKYREQPTPLTSYYVAYYAAGTLGLIQKWLEGGMQQSPSEIAGVMLAILFLKPGDPIELKRGGRNA
jgi:AcrR family transcriptional regulator